MHFSLTDLPHRCYRLLQIERRAASRNRPVVLSRQRIYILPTRYGLVFALLVFVMAVGAANYDNSSGFLLAFLLAALGMMSTLHTYRNLARLSFRTGKTFHVFCGEAARFTVYVDNPGRLPRAAVALQLGDEAPVYADIATGTQTEIELSLPAHRRGYLPISTLTVASRYPLGLFYAWSRIRLNMTCLVYPRPATAVVLPRQGCRQTDGHFIPRPGHDDFLGFRAYQPSDSPRHVDWKAAARGRGLLTKQFADNEQDALWLDWDSLPDMDPEARLSRLCRWVLEAEAGSYRYGLRLPRKHLPLNRGDAHKHLCLQTLALYETA